ncbi:MAG: hypothetical protein AAB507_02210, partial [Patescibacteria group bacterium]
LLLALAAVLILNTINPDIRKLNLKLGTLTQSTTVTSDQTSPNTPPIGTSNTLLDSIFSDETRVRGELSRGGVPVNKSACTSVGQSNCTNVGGLPQQTIDGLLALKIDCECDLVVTGGTEYWLHTAGTSHGPGQRTVDLRPTASLNQFTGLRFVGKPNPASGTIANWGSARFKFEVTGDNAISTGAHWHVTNL